MAVETIEVLMTVQLDEALMAQVEAISPRYHFNVIRTGAVEDIPSNVLEQTEVLYTHWVLPKPEQMPKLRWLQFHWAGIDHAVKEPLLAKQGLMVTTMSGANASQVAEYVLMMLLALGHRMPSLLKQQGQAEWPRGDWQRFRPQELRDSTVGIVGYGSIGRQVSRLLHSFGASVLATKRDVMHPADNGYIPDGMGDPQGDFLTRLYPPQAIASMISECDFVVVTVPLTPDTRNLIGQKEIAVMKPTAFLVDVSRGGVIDSTALIQALQDERIAGAALDVFAQEPLSSDSPLWQMPNVFISPHVSGSTPYYDQRAVALFTQNLENYLTGKPLLNLVNTQLGY